MVTGIRWTANLAAAFLIISLLLFYLHASGSFLFACFYKTLRVRYAKRTE